MRHTQIEAGGDDGIALGIARVTGFDHGAGQINTAHARKAPYDFAGTGCGQRILVVDAGVGHLDHHFTRIKIFQLCLLEARNSFALALVDSKNLE